MDDSQANPPEPLRDPIGEPMDIGPFPAGSTGPRIVSATFTYMLSIVPESEAEQMETLQDIESGTD